MRTRPTLSNLTVHEEDWNVKVNSETRPWPKEFDLRRASVSSFGYGGTNGHVIVESVDSLYPWYQHAKPKREASYNRASSRPFLLTVSAHDKSTLARNAAAINKVAKEYYFTDLAYTLNMSRTRWGHRAFTVAREDRPTEAFDSDLHTGVAFPSVPDVGFLFTGQGVGHRHLTIPFTRC